MSLPDQIDQVFAMPTSAGARVMRLEGYGLDPGDRADVVLLEANDKADAIRRQPAARTVIKNGRLVAETSVLARTYFETA